MLIYPMGSSVPLEPLLFLAIILIDVLTATADMVLQVAGVNGDRDEPEYFGGREKVKKSLGSKEALAVKLCKDN